MINTLSGTGASPSSSVGVAQDVYLLKLNRFILLDKVELADAGSFRVYLKTQKRPKKC